MPYVIENDFKTLIQTENLGQLTGGLASVLSVCIGKAETEVADYLRQKFDLAKEFSTITKYSPTATYKANQRIYLDAVAFSASASYTTNDLVLYQTKVYQAKTSISPGAFNAANWDELGSQYDYFYAKQPHPSFEFDKEYTVGDIVFYKDKNYTAQTSSYEISQQTAIQYVKISDYPKTNTEPGTTKGAAQWGTGTSYSVIGHKPTNTTYWTKGDNRNQVLMGGVIDVALYHLHSRIAPRNIPDLRVKRYDDFIRYLREVAKGNLSVDLPLLEPKKSSTIRVGGKPKQINEY